MSELCQCRVCRRCKNRAKNARYRERNREKVNEAARAAYLRDKEERPDVVREKKRRYYERNAVAVLKRQREKYHAKDKRSRARSNHRQDVESVRRYKREWARSAWAKNPEKHRARVRATMNRRRARLRDACSPGVTPSEWKAICERFVRDGVVFCAYCGKRPGATADHVVPIARGGRDEPSNVVPSCKPCNCSKGKKLLAEWRNPDAPISKGGVASV